jgi:amidophosphoribosyltransferase
MGAVTDVHRPRSTPEPPVPGPVAAETPTDLFDPFDDHPKEACGVFAVYGPGLPVAQLTYLGLFALQHRGQEAAGMAVSDHDTVTVVKDQGLVASVFDERTLAGLGGDLAIGHTRYSTTGSSTWRNAQPSYRSVGDEQFALGHNGNLVNTAKLAAEAGMLEGTVTSDTDLVAELVAQAMARLPDPYVPGGGADDAGDVGYAGGSTGVVAAPDPGAALIEVKTNGHDHSPSGNGSSPVNGSAGTGLDQLDEMAGGLDERPAAGHAGANDRGDRAAWEPQRPLEDALVSVLPLLEGAFSLVVMDEDCIVGVRDPQGFRPLCLGRLDDAWVLASETPALDIVGATFVRELEPGEMVVVDDDGPRSFRPFGPERVDPKLCLFEFVYFARPDSWLYDRSVHAARVAMGAQLAEQAPVEADMVTGVPESGVPAAEGFARHSGIPLGQGMVKNRYIGRSFIAPSQEARARAVRMKLNPLRENVAGKRLVVIDDSIVRGTTQKQLVTMLREAGAEEVHLRISSPPVMWSCFFGIDTGDRNELIAHTMTIDEIAQHLDVDSLAYLDLDRLLAATGAAEQGFCDACFTGDYPVEVPLEVGKHVLEARLSH